MTATTDDTIPLHPDVARARDRQRALELIRVAPVELTYRSLADLLSDAGVPVLGGRAGARWCPSSVYCLMRAEGLLAGRRHRSSARGRRGRSRAAP
jgi:hypothetical protein